MSIAQQLVQASHAAHESGLHHSPTEVISSVIIFGTPNKEHLEHLLQKYQKHINCFPFFEPYKDIGLTAFATMPIGEELRPLFKEFKLWKPIDLSCQKSCQIMTRNSNKPFKSIT